MEQLTAQLHAAAAQWVETGRELGRIEALDECATALSRMLDEATEKLDGDSTTGDDTLAAMAAWRDGRQVLWRLIDERRLLLRARVGQGREVARGHRKVAQQAVEGLLQQVRKPWPRRLGAALEAAAAAWQGGR